MNKLIKFQTIVKVVAILLLGLLPWVLNNSSSDISPIEVTDDLSFYEINSCEFSLAEVLLKNPKIAYQKHFRISPNNYSTIQCFGKITGLDRIGNTFYISVGTNSLLSLIIKSLTLLIIISFIGKHEPVYKFLGFRYNLICFVSTLLLTFGIYAEKRFYLKSLYYLDLDLFSSYLIIFLFFFFCVFISLELMNTRYYKLINYFPYLFFLIGVLHGFNLHIYTFLVVILGVMSLFFTNILKRNNSWIMILFPLIWIINSRDYNFTLDLDKIIGFSSSTFNVAAVTYWSIIFLLLVAGIYSLIERSVRSLDYKIINNNLLISSSLVVLFGLLGANATVINFLNFYYFGQNKVGMRTLDVVDGNTWRGFFPSAETIGQFYGLTILFCFIYCLQTRHKLKVSSLIMLGITFFGLVKTNNFSVFLSVLFISVIYYLQLDKKLNIKMFAYFFGVLLIGLIYLYSNNYLYTFEFTNNKILEQGLMYSNDYQLSTSIKYLQDTDSKLVKFVIGTLSTVSFYINRSTLWGIFFSRYNPSQLELFFGTGPFNLSKHYSEINLKTPTYKSADIFIQNVEAFLLPHSSLLDILLYFGLVGIFLGIYFIIKLLLRRKEIEELIFYPLIFLLINLVKDDSILYFPSIVLIMFFVLLSNIKQPTNRQ